MVLCAAAVAPSLEHCASTSTLSMDQQIQIARSMNESTRQSTVAANLNARATDAFWPVYREYRTAVNGLNDQLKNIILRYAERYRDLSGDEAYSLSEQTVNLEIRREKLKQKYLKRFRKVLSPLDAARVFQIENKLDALSRVTLAAEIPLVREEDGR